MFATFARLMLHGGRPYVDFADIHPPLGYAYWMFVELLAGTDWSRTCLGAWGSSLAPQPCISLVAHLLDLALTFVTAGLTYAIARQLGLRPLFGVLAALCVVWFANESMISMEGSTPTKLTLAPSTLAIYAFLRALQAGSRPWAITAGAAAMLGVMAKQPALTTSITLVAYLIPGLVRGGRSERRVLLDLVVGGVIVLLPTLVLLGVAGSLQGFWSEPWVYNIQRFVSGYWQTPAGLSSPATRIDRVVAQSGGVLFLGALIGGIALAFGPCHGRQRLLLVWGVCNLAAIAGFREFAQVVPSMALLAAIGLGRLWDAAGRDGLGLGRPLAGRLALLAVFGTVFLLTSSFQLTELRRAQFERGPGARPADPELIGAYLRDTAPPGPIFTWGNEAQIYALSGRQPSSRFLITEFPRLGSPWATISRQQVLEDLQAKPPAVIVVDPHASEESEISLGGFPQLQQLLDRCYAKVPQMPAGWGVYAQTDAGCGL
ncbi:MAG: glycosyltransferase family 39 protein [Chloroflexi bacterium]|nr:glycosyltransferase family 39 protein [Chloroflexota bacterium]